MSTAPRTLLLAACGLLVIAPCVALDGGRAVPDGRHDVVIASALMLAGCLGAARLIWRGATRTQLWLVVLVAIVARFALALEPPLVSDDAHRFVWDGRVQLAGVNPYRFAPSDPALTGLRDAQVWPKINRPSTRTIYPPTNELAFAASAAAGLGGVRAIKVLWLALEGAAIGLLVVLLARCGLPPSRAVLYAWHPLALVEIAWSAHPDVLVVVAVLAALLAWDRSRGAVIGVALATAALAKLLPLLLFAPLRRRLGARGVAAAALTAVVLYAPYASAGGLAIGSVSEYAGGRYGAGPFAWLTAAGIDAGVARGLLLLALAIGAAALAARPPRDLRGATMACALLLGGALLASHNVRPWYLLWCLPLLCIVPLRGLLWAAATVPLLYVTAANGRWLDPLAASAIVWGPTIALLVHELWPARRRVADVTRV